MAKLDELIAKYCPDGVEYKKIKDISIMKRGNSLTKKDATEGNIPVISGGKEPAFYCDKFNRENETITVAGSGAGAGYVQYWNEPIFVCDAFSIKANNINKTKYLYYCLTNIQDKIYATKTGGGIPHVHISNIENFVIPVPPLEVQCEIVRILDNFTELTARKKQYEHYRDELLTFDDSVPRYNLEYLTNKIVDGSHNPPKPTLADITIPMISAKNINNGVIDFVDARLLSIMDYETENKRTNVSVGDVLLTIVGAIGRVAVVMEDIKMVFQRSICVLKPKSIILSKYLKYALESTNIQNYINIQASGAAQKGIYLKQVAKILIPLPSLEEQKRIVSILDRFDALCNDISEGLPAEIEARQKQYEYYRDKLLTFKEKFA